MGFETYKIKTDKTFVRRSHVWSVAPRLFTTSFYDLDTFFSGYKSDALSKINTGMIKIVDSKKVWSASGNRTILSSDFIEVHPSNKYILSGFFKSTGSIASKIYFGLSPFSVRKESITSFHVLRVGSSNIVTDINDEQIIVSESLSGWLQPPEGAGRRSIGFYYDGDITKVPDYIHTYYPDGYSDSSPEKGAFSSAENFTISLNTPLPVSVTNNIILNQTVVKNHYAGSTYLYCSASASIIPNDWTSYAGSIRGEGFGNDLNMFRQGTRFVKILFLLNYQQGIDSEVVFDEILFRSV